MKQKLMPRPKPIRELTMKAVMIAPWDGSSGLTYSLIGLSTHGKVYRFELGCGRWVPYNMEALTQ